MGDSLEKLVEQRRRAGLQRLWNEGTDGSVVRARILIVDDEPASLRALVRQFRCQPHHVETASSGAQAIERALAEPYDLILCDLHLQDVGASAFWEALRAAGAGKERTLVFMLAGLVDERVLQLSSETSRPVLEKPIMPGDVEALLGWLPEAAGAPG